MRHLAAPVLLVAVVAAAVAAALVSVRSGPPGPPRVRLAVLVVFDQMRGDFVDRWRPLFGRDGFARIQSQGAWFTRCHYPYGRTTTGPGHASILSGTCPDRHGIIDNAWYEGGATVYCAGSPRYEFVPALPHLAAKKGDVGNPDRMLAETVADALKAQRPGAKVFGLSLKDRSAILPTGKRPDGAFWFDRRFVTSTYYADRLPAWAERFNASGAVDAWFGRDWVRSRADVDYPRWSGADAGPGEGAGVQVRDGKDKDKGWKQGVGFPHPNTGGKDKPGKEYYEALANSPFGNELLLQFAKECVAAEGLGADDVPDLLVVSFSSNDLIGHTWGPDSQEVLDVTLRSDAVVAELLRFLDATVGAGHYLVGITADHGSCPLPEASRARGLDARRVDPGTIVAAVDRHLTATFGPPAATGDKKPGWFAATPVPWLYFDAKTLAMAGTNREAAAATVAGFLATHPGVVRAYTRAEVEARSPTADPLLALVRRSAYSGRSGDVFVLMREWDLPSGTTGTGTTHGSPYDYDRHVPLMVYGPGVGGGALAEPTTPQAMAAIFSKWLGVRPPRRADFPLPAALRDR
jgi:predicted AlkP superfamily pyrophosphatase or phosphodiesterase